MSRTAFLFLVTPGKERPYEIRLDVPADEASMEKYRSEMGVRSYQLYPFPVKGISLQVDEEGLLRGATEPLMDQNTALMDVLCNFGRTAKKSKKPYATDAFENMLVGMWMRAPLFGGAAMVFEDSARTKSFRDDLRSFILTRILTKGNPNILVVPNEEPNQ